MDCRWSEISAWRQSDNVPGDRGCFNKNSTVNCHISWPQAWTHIAHIARCLHEWNWRLFGEPCFISSLFPILRFICLLRFRGFILNIPDPAVTGTGLMKTKLLTRRYPFQKNHTHWIRLTWNLLVKQAKYLYLNSELVSFGYTAYL